MPDVIRLNRREMCFRDLYNVLLRQCAFFTAEICIHFSTKYSNLDTRLSLYNAASTGNLGEYQVPVSRHVFDESGLKKINLPTVTY